MKPLVLALGLASGVAGALLVRWLEPPREERTATPAARPAPTIDEALIARIVAAELDRRLPPPTTARGVEPPAARPAAPEGEGPGEGGAEAAPAAPDAEIGELVSGLRNKKLAPADLERLFGWLSNHPTRISAVIEAIQKEIAADPRNPELHVALAMAYVADLWNNTADGPQRGQVWMKAQAAYDAAIKLDPEHWQARFGKAFGTSMAPEAFGMRPSAIKQFEELLEIQKRKAPEPQFADTYFRLGTLYKDAGNVEKARELWAEGLRLFPDNEELKGTIEASTKR